mmetsp:Transcript_4449/g.11303  ORF Transcript_4449/g.11303 Transcript_4449/m.11303 type:complete len:676 (+) Transcript_4449:20-2047(+)|eukprot:CAMPEP_0182925438 /NCGR_PEP_ID=MMETSP0105_2-20130417/9412_1 /TAXON_ID=81532 ORGANISM="Acanthoeca-like sp., Strain 10tr" /NCGR_SAMPLE_ID=MMETSP0105_2 /ASSEMBLY_ACC=CAM_ASM_000205 /LENGTH=675 /DNA_ID=CAMNT_0025063287 /DNA_START=15 /DNA_END=2042 /DNA_ORIENTATION=-
MAEWPAFYLGVCELNGFRFKDVDITTPAGAREVDDYILAASKSIRKGKNVEKIGMNLESRASVALVGTPTDGGSSIYQPSSKIIKVHVHKEGGFNAKHYVSYLLCDNETYEYADDCRFFCRTFRVKTEDVASKLKFGIERMLVNNSNRGRPVEKPIAEYNQEELENAVNWWNAGKDQMYHYQVVKDGRKCHAKGVVNVSNDAEGQVEMMSKKFIVTSTLCGNELLKTLGDKFNLDGVSLATHALCEVQYDGKETILNDTDNPIARTFTWADPSERKFVLRELPEGQSRAIDRDNAAAAAHAPPMKSYDLDDASLGPQLPYCEQDEDLLLAVMISRQTGNGLGFKLTPAYLLQMCLAYVFANGTPEDVGRLLNKITDAITKVVTENPLNAELLLFWCCNSMRFLEYVGSRSDLHEMFKTVSGNRLDKTLGVGLGLLAELAEKGTALPAPLTSQRWSTEEELRVVIFDYYRSLDSKMSTANLQEVIERITAAMPSAHLRHKALANGIEVNKAGNETGVDEDGGDYEGNPNVDPLPPEWEELVDQETKHRFFANHITRQTSWTDPRATLTKVTLTKGAKGLGIGLSGARRTQDDRLVLGIFVNSLVQNTAAAIDGTLREGDEILEVDNDSLIGVSKDQAIEYLKRVPMNGDVTLLVSQEPDRWEDPDKAKAAMRHTTL